MKVLITGSSSGIGRQACIKFLAEGHTVYGFDVKEDTITGNCSKSNNYTHYICDVAKKDTFPELPMLDIVINNAGVQTEGREGMNDINVNLLGAMNITEKYAFQENIKAVLFNSSVSALSGNEFPYYVASKAGINGYMKNCAIRLANEYHAVCNSICFGGVATELNKPVMDDKELWENIMKVTPLKRWATVQQAAEWIYFLTVINNFCTGQTIDVSGGERNCADLFVWPEKE